MRYMSRLFVICVLAMVAAGCDPEVDEQFFQNDDVSLVRGGEVLFKYHGSTCQLAYNAGRNEFRAMTDEMSDYFVLRCEEDLSDVGQEVKADLFYTTSDNVKRETGLVFTVERTAPSKGMFWLWCGSRKIGVVVRKI